MITGGVFLTQMTIDDDLYAPIPQDKPPAREWFQYHQFDETTGRCMRCGMTYQDYQAYSEGCRPK